MATDRQELDRVAQATEIVDSLTLLTTLYPHAGYLKSQVLLLADVWAEDLAAYPAETIREAVLRHRRSSPHFPTPADMIRLCAEVEDEREASARLTRARLALPEPLELSDEQRERNLRWGSEIIAKVARNMDARPRREHA